MADPNDVVTRLEAAIAEMRQLEARVIARHPGTVQMLDQKVLMRMSDVHQQLETVLERTAELKRIDGSDTPPAQRPVTADADRAARLQAEADRQTIADFDKTLNFTERAYLAMGKLAVPVAVEEAMTRLKIFTDAAAQAPAVVMDAVLTASGRIDWSATAIAAQQHGGNVKINTSKATKPPGSADELQSLENDSAQPQGRVTNKDGSTNWTETAKAAKQGRK